MKTLLTLLATAPFAGAAVFAPALSNETESNATANGEASSALNAALDSISEDSIRADIHFIASDELAGRDTPSDGLRIAARFIVARLQRLGFQPGASDGFLYEYQLDYKRLDGDKTKLTFTNESGAATSLRFGSDYYGYFSSGETLDVQGGITFVGAESDEAFEGLDLAGKWALTIEDGSRWRQVRRRAEKAGALGVIRVMSPESEEGIPTRLGRYAQRLLQGSVSYPRKSDKPARQRDPSYPFVYVTRATLEGVMGSLDSMKPGDSAPFELRDERMPLADGGQATLENVCGFWPGRDPELKNEVLILSAHYDHVGTSGDKIFNGADDNGSGTTGLLALAEALQSYGPMRRSVMLMWVSGEEKGLFGSRAWTEDPWLPEGMRAVCNVNIDMIGRNEPDKLMITPTKDHESYNGLTKLAERVAPLEGFPVLGNADPYWQRSDHYNFRKNLNIPVAFLFSDVHEDYHKETDTPDKIDYDKIRRVVRTVMRMLDGLQTDTLDL